MSGERSISPSQVIRVILGERPRNYGNAREGIVAHKHHEEIAIQHALGTLPTLNPPDHAIPKEQTHYIDREVVFEAQLLQDLLLRARVDLIVNQNTIEMKPNLRLRHLLQCAMNCLARQAQTEDSVEGALYFYVSDTYQTIPQGGEVVWPLVPELCDAAHEIHEIQQQLDFTTDMNRRVPKEKKHRVRKLQLSFDDLGHPDEEKILSAEEFHDLSSVAVRLRYDTLDPIVQEMSHIASEWV